MEVLWAAVEFAYPYDHSDSITPIGVYVDLDQALKALYIKRQLEDGAEIMHRADPRGMAIIDLMRGDECVASAFEIQVHRLKKPEVKNDA